MKTVNRLKSFAKKIGMSERHVQRLIAAGEGPVLTELGKRIKGVTDDDGDAWLARRRQLPPGWVDPPVQSVTADRELGINKSDADAPTEILQRIRAPVTDCGRPSAPACTPAYSEPCASSSATSMRKARAHEQSRRRTGASEARTVRNLP
jgi:hypothetical protein